MQSSVQPTGWQSALPRLAYQSYPQIQVPGNTWYEVYEVRPGVFALYEPGHFQEVISFLIIGNKAALLWDTGMGIAPISPVIKALTPLPLTVVNSHNHFDHVGGNWEFDTVYGYPSPLSRQRADIGYTPALLDPMLGADSLAKPLPANFTSNSFTIQPWHYSPLETYKEPTMTKNEVGLRLTGQAFNLGDRVLEVLHTPGHTQDSIMLWDRTHRILFTGDTVYPAALYAHYGCPEFGYSDPETYARTMQDVAYLATELDCLCCSHNIAVFDPNLLIQVAKGFADIRQNLIEGTLGPDCLLRYDFVDFAIIMNPPSANIKLA